MATGRLQRRALGRRKEEGAKVEGQARRARMGAKERGGNAGKEERRKGGKEEEEEESRKGGRGRGKEERRNKTARRKRLRWKVRGKRADCAWQDDVEGEQ